MGFMKRQNRNDPHSGMMFREPKAINATQVAINCAAALSGAMAVVGGFPLLLTGQVGPVLASIIGCILMVGGVAGGIAVLYGNWWLERVALLITALGWLLLVPALLSYAASGRAPGGAWLVVALLFAAIGDIIKRYLRIQWAYLDPRR